MTNVGLHKKLKTKHIDRLYQKATHQTDHKVIHTENTEKNRKKHKSCRLYNKNCLNSNYSHGL